MSTQDTLFRAGSGEVARWRPYAKAGVALSVPFAFLCLSYFPVIGWALIPIAITTGLTYVSPQRLAFLRFLCFWMFGLAYALVGGFFFYLMVYSGECAPTDCFLVSWLSVSGIAFVTAAIIEQGCNPGNRPLSPPHPARKPAWIGILLTVPISAFGLLELPETLRAFTPDKDHANFCMVCNSVTEVILTFLFNLFAALLPILLVVLTLRIKRTSPIFPISGFILGGVYYFIVAGYTFYLFSGFIFFYDLIFLFPLVIIAAGVAFFIAAKRAYTFHS